MSETGGIKRGYDCKLFVNEGSFAAPSWIEVDNVGDLTRSQTKDTVEVKSRRNHGYKAKLGTLKDASVEFDMVHDEADLGYQAVEAAYEDDTDLDVVVTSGGARGFRMIAQVTEFGENQKLGDIVANSVKIEPAYVADVAQAPHYVDNVSSIGVAL